MMVRQRMTLCLLFLLGFLWHTPMQAQQALQYPQVLQPMQSPQSLQPPAERSGEKGIRDIPFYRRKGEIYRSYSSFQGKEGFVANK